MQLGSFFGDSLFQHTAARRRLVNFQNLFVQNISFQHTAARRRLGNVASKPPNASRFNTQPPEGGWFYVHRLLHRQSCFNTQPPEGGWPASMSFFLTTQVSTHSRPKAAGLMIESIILT